ncbi:hypothetical protein FDW83_14580 [Pseudarthrobacter sp. NamE2]|uniref:hypothetical protein n=1 Tax=Pseudarthrobacter sp. NamE2 TaxID=2576838 RepID=UPI0010FCF0B6|nr:hypothetical protein [Pseudarthrobacter sp. NamE2]TLM81953.1 hypothetical protein FDW83_14580 [Pseudarthrobacter sp. NamE2]
MQPSSDSVVIRTFTSGQWDGLSNPRPVNVFAAMDGKGLCIGFVVFAIFANLAGFWLALLVFAVIAVIVAINRTRGSLSPQQHFVNALLADVNDTLVELTGNREAILSVTDLVALRQSGYGMPITVNGVSGLSLSVVSDAPRQEHLAAIARVSDRVWTTQVVVSASAPDYGTASFDRLLMATVATD